MKLNFVLSLLLVISFVNQVIPGVPDEDHEPGPGNTTTDNPTVTDSTADEIDHESTTATEEQVTNSSISETIDTDSSDSSTTTSGSTKATTTGTSSVSASTTKATTIGTTTEAATMSKTTEAATMSTSTNAATSKATKKSTNPTDISNSQLTFSPIPPSVDANGEDNDSPNGNGRNNLLIAFGICACIAGVILISCYFVRRSAKAKRQSSFRRLFDDNDDDLLAYESGIHTMDPLEDLAQTSFTDEVDTSDRDRVIYRPQGFDIKTTPMDTDRLHLS